MAQDSHNQLCEALEIPLRAIFTRGFVVRCLTSSTIKFIFSLEQIYGSSEFPINWDGRQQTLYRRKTVTSTVWIHHKYIIFAEIHLSLSDLKQSFTDK